MIAPKLAEGVRFRDRFKREMRIAASRVSCSSILAITQDDYLRRVSSLALDLP